MRTRDRNPQRGSAEWWQHYIVQLDHLFVRDHSSANFSNPKIRQECIDRGSLRRPPATEEELRRLEAKLGISLCPSYRALLLTSNGLESFGPHPGRLLSTFEVDWFPNRNPDIARDVRSWLASGNRLNPPYALDEAWRVDIPLRSIEITENYDACTIILCPENADSDGEWQVWLEIVGEYQRFETLPAYMEAALAER